MRPLWIILILLAVNAATIGAMLLVRRRAPEGSYTTYDQSRSGGEAEALTVIQQFETAELLPPAVRDRTSGEIVCYGRSVVHQECPQMQDGKGGDTINPWSIALFRSLQRRRPVHAMGRRVARDETELAAFYDKRFRPEFKPAFDAWVATRPRKNPSAPRRRSPCRSTSSRPTQRPTASR